MDLCSWQADLSVASPRERQTTAGPLAAEASAREGRIARCRAKAPRLGGGLRRGADQVFVGVGRQARHEFETLHQAKGRSPNEFETLHQAKGRSLTSKQLQDVGPSG